ncbi:RND family efflux transporter MFP subunit [Anaerobacterium chartisolvens]|uniref:RND family efflux transporter MFP subunit n=1 Tax=Anaerobacterium chartisolvens TaxID=1297424 RepID=A0A369B6Q1_9FIRM|nr:HlyD family efflux transporter periplasmic adaptor subunit [Anaerobacterium chartisolvens]RCX17190.1 RND family efflux transporter MFP subunit [Anaerobacterium chartisolvens]
MLKKIISMLLITVLTMSFAACSKQEKEVGQEKIKPVKVTEVKEENKPFALNYVGRVDSSETKKYSFQSAGEIAAIYVEKGQPISENQKLLELDTKDLMFSVEATRLQMASVQAQYDKALNGSAQEDIKKAELNVKKAQDVYNYANDLYEKTKMLYENGGVSRDALDKARLDMDTKAIDLNHAKEVEQEVKKGAREEDKTNLLNQLEAAKTNYDAKKSLLENTEVKSDMEGHVVDVLVKQGEVVAAGAPVLLVRSSKMVVNAGIAQKDINRIGIDTRADIEIDGKQFIGRVAKIDQVPDKQTWTYNIQIELPEGSHYIGAIAKVGIEAEAGQGIWIPVSSIMNGEYDYVFTAVDGRAARKKISMEKTQGNLVMVKGLVSGDMLVVEGMKSLKDGDRIEIKRGDS